MENSMSLSGFPFVYQESSLEEVFVAKLGRHTEKHWNSLCRSWRQAFMGLAVWL